MFKHLMHVQSAVYDLYFRLFIETYLDESHCISRGWSFDYLVRLELVIEHFLSFRAYTAILPCHSTIFDNYASTYWSAVLYLKTQV